MEVQSRATFAYFRTSITPVHTLTSSSLLLAWTVRSIILCLLRASRWYAVAMADTRDADHALPTSDYRRTYLRQKYHVRLTRLITIPKTCRLVQGDLVSGERNGCQIQGTIVRICFFYPPLLSTDHQRLQEATGAEGCCARCCARCRCSPLQCALIICTCVVHHTRV